MARRPEKDTLKSKGILEGMLVMNLHILASSLTPKLIILMCSFDLLHVDHVRAFP